MLRIITKPDRLGNVGVEDWRVTKDVDNVLEDNLYKGKNTIALGAVLNRASCNVKALEKHREKHDTLSHQHLQHTHNQNNQPT